MGIGFCRSSRYSNLVLIIIATTTTLAMICVPTADAGRFELKNELRGLRGREGILSVRCWSTHDRLGIMTVMPGQSRSWTFKTVKLWPLAYTEFRCELGTKFGLTVQVVFKADTSFLWECDKPRKDECIWVAKNDGLYLRRKTAWFGRGSYNDVRKSTWGRGSYLHSRDD
ncbi:PREDICTED: uncharacterized protein LOC104811314 [Tarenaya hassleriana]|uniref:uncharacterized protein LOC104811314 n=1 Tax=Tarenaya hassleriana TaxID=28532 RepID=UPI00053C20AF|nr:PREDICTED: uncharacterized protein LOC104811314 [Tarenaya hassleriana]